MLLLDTIDRKAVDQTPVWIMRQAGHYLPEYRSIREKHDFLSICRTPELATEVTLQPIRRYQFDAAILFSDMLVLPEAMGLQLEYNDDLGPQVTPAIRRETDIKNLQTEGLGEKLRYVSQAVNMIRASLSKDIALIGFSGSPFTLASYMIEGRASKNFRMVKRVLYRKPEMLHQLLEVMTTAVVQFLRLQIQAGVQVVQLFDSWAGLLPPHLYDEFSASYQGKVISQLADTGVPVILYGRGPMHIIESLKSYKPAVLGVDWQADMVKARTIAGSKIVLQGNLDPACLYASAETIRKEVGRLLKIFKGQGGHIFNLGQGILPDVNPDMVHVLVDEVREQSMRSDD